MGKQNIYRRVLIEQFQLVVEFTNIYYVRIKVSKENVVLRRWESITG